LEKTAEEIVLGAGAIKEAHSMLKTFLVALAAVALSCAGVAQARNAEKAQTEDQDDAFARPRRMSSEDMAAFSQARVAALKAGLQLKPEQEKSWPALETALSDAAKARIANMEEWRDKAPATFDTDPIGALQRRALNMSARAGAFEKIGAAAKPLYDSLDEGQKRRFGPLLQAAIGGRGMGAGRGGGMGMGRGMGGHHHHHMHGR
jgi:hypothetical protein